MPMAITMLVVLGIAITGMVVAIIGVVGGGGMAGGGGGGGGIGGGGGGGGGPGGGVTMEGSMAGIIIGEGVAIGAAATAPLLQWQLQLQGCPGGHPALAEA